MTQSRTVQEMTLSARRRADMENSTKVSDTEIMEYLDDGVNQLTEKLIAYSANDRYRSTQTISVVSGTNTYDCPTDWFASDGFRTTINGARVKIHRGISPDFDTLSANQQQGWNFCHPTYYIRNRQIIFQPSPTAAYSVTHYFISFATKANTSGSAIDRFTAQTDTFNGEWGWHNWVVLHAAMKCLMKENSTEEAGSCLGEMSRIEADIQKIAKDAVIDEPPHRKGRLFTRDGFLGESFSDYDDWPIYR